MSLKYTGVGNGSSVSISIIADGASDSIIIELEKALLNQDIKSNLPVALFGTSFGNSVPGTAVLNSDRRSVTVTFDTPPTPEQGGSVTFLLVYGGK